MNTGALDTAVRDLKEHKDQWARLPVKEKLPYLQTIMSRQVELAERQVTAAAQAKDIPQGTVLMGEEWSSGPYCAVRNLRLLIHSLKQLASKGQVRLPNNSVRTRGRGQVVVNVFPLSLLDQISYPGFRGEVWMQDGVTSANLPKHMAGFYQHKSQHGKVALVLGAGCITSTGLLDIVHKLYVEGQVCLYKNNPFSWYMAPFLEECLADLIRDGYVRLVSGWGDMGDYLCQHPDIDEIHLTGSVTTHDAIVFGTGEGGAKRKHRHEPRLDKRLTCVLGNVSPVIVVPGPWKSRDVEFHAQNITGMMIQNNGFNCSAAKVLILPEMWPQSRELKRRIRSLLASAPQRKAFYPGAEERFDRLTSSRSTVITIGERKPGYLPYTFIPDIESNDKCNIAFTTEVFGPWMGQTALPGASAKEFLHQAIEFCNTVLWGTLSACIILHPETMKMLGPALDQAIADLRYGTIAVNHWPALGFLWGSTTWGAFPGQTAENIQSGVGMVHNTFLFDNPQKSVIYGPFRTYPKPLWFATNRNAHRTIPKLVRLEADPSLLKIPSVAASAIWG